MEVRQKSIQSEHIYPNYFTKNPGAVIDDAFSLSGRITNASVNPTQDGAKAVIIRLFHYTNGSIWFEQFAYGWTVEYGEIMQYKKMAGPGM